MPASRCRLGLVLNSEAATNLRRGRPVNVPRRAPQRKQRSFPKHDVKPGLMRLRDEEKTITWDSARKRSRPNRRLLLLLLVLPFLLGSLGAAPTAPTVHADELSEARARQSQLKKQIAAQQRQIARLNGLQRDLSKDIAATKSELKSINADLVAVKKRITRMKKKIEEVKAAYAALLERGEELDAELTKLQAEEAAAAASLADRKAELAQRIRSAYDGRIALVALTGYGADQDVRRALDAGFEVHLTKPVDPAELDALLARAA